MEKIYLDNAATTKIDDTVLETMMNCYKECYGNPSGIYSDGVKAKRLLSDARRTIAETLNANDENIIFTGGGSESDNLAIVGALEKYESRGKHFIVSAVEHHAVLNTAEYMAKRGFSLSYAPVNKDGIVVLDELLKLIRPDTVLISVMYANNETGVLQPIEEIGKICKERGIVFHCDAVQAYGKVAINPKKLGIDLLSVSAHKFYGPKGVGFLYVANNTKINSFIHGGEQERGLRAGTENVSCIVGMAEAAKLAYLESDNTSREHVLLSHFKERVLNEISNIEINGDFENSIGTILNFSIQGIEGESLLIMLDMKGIEASTGSACVMSLKEPSHVIRAMGRTIEEARSSVRFSVGKYNTIEEIDYTVQCLKESVEYLRKIRC